ncbi:hypothetical protein H0Z60_14555 [Ectothiorhodospiraceae bacterium WFHF3C12]|nr:hypothetical protein [Ectothiorhodospiraceae bacterium WFHF3C12]
MFEMLDKFALLGPAGEHVRHGWLPTLPADSVHEALQGESQLPQQGRAWAAEAFSAAFLRLATRVVEDLSAMASQAYPPAEAQLIMPPNLLDELIPSDQPRDSDRPLKRLIALWQMQLERMDGDAWPVVRIARSIPPGRNNRRSMDLEEQKRRLREWRNGEELPNNTSVVRFALGLLRRAQKQRDPSREFLWLRSATLCLAVERLQREISGRGHPNSAVVEAYRRQRPLLQ